MTAYIYLDAYCMPGTISSTSHIPAHLIPSTISTVLFPLKGEKTEAQRDSIPCLRSEVTEPVSLSPESILLTTYDKTTTETIWGAL